MTKTGRLTIASLLFGTLAGSAAAGTITVQNWSSLTVPQTRVYKTCLGAFASQIFGSLDTGQSQTQTRTSPVLGACVWAREVGIEPRYISCFVDTFGLPDPSEPAEILVTWSGSTVDDLTCTVSVS